MSKCGENTKRMGLQYDTSCNWQSGTPGEMDAERGQDGWMDTKHGAVRLVKVADDI